MIALVHRDPRVREIIGTSLAKIRRAVPWVSEGNQGLVGSEVELELSPPVKVKNIRLPFLIYPNEKAPPGKPILHREAIFISSKNVTEVRSLVEVHSEKVVEIEPLGEDTKAKSIGPQPTDPAYAPEPGR